MLGKWEERKCRRKKEKVIRCVVWVFDIVVCVVLYCFLSASCSSVLLITVTINRFLQPMQQLIECPLVMLL